MKRHLILGVLVVNTIFAGGIPTDPRQRHSSYPYLTGDTFRVFCDHIVDETKVPFNPKNVKSGDTVFVNNDIIDHFFNKLHPKIEHPYVLVSHNSIYSLPGKHADKLKDEKIIAWFGKNADMSYEKMVAIPLGVANRYWAHQGFRHGNIGTLEKVRKKVPAFQTRWSDKPVYLNFASNTNPDARTKPWQLFCNSPFCFRASRKSFEGYLTEMAQFPFTISPPGSSIDCHRVWEAFYVGTVPIMISTLLDPLFEGMPVIIVQQWEDVTIELLKTKFEEFCNMDWNEERIYAEYYFNLIRQAQAPYRAI